jgi:septum formation inhibitor MinC
LKTVDGCGREIWRYCAYADRISSENEDEAERKKRNQRQKTHLRHSPLQLLQLRSHPPPAYAAPMPDFTILESILPSGQEHRHK